MDAAWCFIYILLHNNPPQKLSDLKQRKCIPHNSAVWAQVIWKLPPYGICWGWNVQDEFVTPMCGSTTLFEAWYSISYHDLSRVAGHLYLMASGSKTVSKRTSPSLLSFKPLLASRTNTSHTRSLESMWEGPWKM